MAKIKLLLHFLLWIPFIAFSQSGKIDTDRPDQSESAFTVPEKWIQVETGIGLQKNNHARDYEYALPSILSKYGISKRIELRLITTYQSHSTILIPTGTVTEAGLLPVEVGTKINLSAEKKFLPKTSLLFHLGFPSLGSKKFATAHVAPRFRFAFQKTLSASSALGCNLGAEWDGSGNSDPAWIYTLSPGFDLSEKWYAYVEVFGFIYKDESPEHTLAAGIAWYANKDLKIDLSGGFGISPAAPVYYTAAGFSFRIHTKK
ncbi:MAG: transporter [Ferruginibacter sp.]